MSDSFGLSRDLEKVDLDLTEFEEKEEEENKVEEDPVFSEIPVE